MTSDWKDGILLVILLFISIFLIFLDLYTDRYKKKEDSEFNPVLDYIKECDYASKIGATGVVISFEEESQNES